MPVHVGELEREAKLPDSKLTTNRALAAFNELSRFLSGLDGLPLTVRELHATGAHLLGCGMFGMRPNVRNVFAEVLEIVLSFESSRAWLENPVAISASKSAFYLAFKNGLEKIGVDSRVTISYMDVELSRFVFRLLLAVDKERELLDGSFEGGTLDSETAAAVWHHEYIRNMPSEIFGVVLRLAKRWLKYTCSVCVSDAVATWRCKFWSLLLCSELLWGVCHQIRWCLRSVGGCIWWGNFPGRFSPWLLLGAGRGSVW